MRKKKSLIIALICILVIPLALTTSTTFSKQSDWQQGIFKLTTADREDNSGILGLGYENGTLNDTLKGFWRFDRTSGDIIDYSGNGNSGDVYGANRGANGILSTNAPKFDGSADEVIILDDNSLDFSEGLALSAWVKADEQLNVDPSMSQNPEIISKGNSYSLTIQNENYIAFSKNNQLKLLNKTGHVTNLGVSTSVIGPLSDYDQDGVIDIPYVDSSGNLDIINKNGNNQNLAAGAKASSSTLGAGDLDNDGRKEIYYIDSSSSNLRKYDFSSSTDSLVGGGIAGTAISGVADYDGDGNKDLVFLDSTQTISWYDGSSVQSTGKSIAGSNSYQHWIGGTTGPGVGKYDSSWTDLSGNANAPTNSIYSGTYTGKAYYLGGGSGEVTRWDGAFTDISPSTSNNINAISSRPSEVLAGAGTDIYLRNTNTGSWTQPAIVDAAMESASNSYSSSSIGDFWLLGHGKTNQPGGVKSYVSKFDGSTVNYINGGFNSQVNAIDFNGTHYLAGSSNGRLAVYDGTNWNQVNQNTIGTTYSIEYGSINGDSFWLIGGASGNVLKLQEDGTTTALSTSYGNSVRAIGYSGDSEKFFLGDGSGNIAEYTSNGMQTTSQNVLSNSVRTLMYNPASSRKKMGTPSDLDNDGEVEVPIVTDGSNLALVPNSGSTNVIDSGYGSAKASPLGTVDWNGNPAEEIIHINTNSDTLYLSDISGNEQAVTRSDSTQVTGVDQSPGISAGSMPEGTPVLQINGQNVLNKGGQPLNPGSWTMITAKYNASTGLAELYFNSTLIASKTTSLGKVNPNSQDFKIANGKLNATIDEVKAYNESLSSNKIDRLFFNGTDGQFDGAYNSTIINPEGKKSWNEFMLDVNESADTSVSATVYSLDGSNNIINTNSITVNDGTQNYSISSLPNSKKIKFSFDGYSTDIKDTWEIFQTDIYYEDSFKVGNVSHDDYGDQHKFNISATARGADTDGQISGCTAYYTTSGFSGYSTVSEGGGSAATIDRTYGSGNHASCNTTISPSDLFRVGYPNYPKVTFKFNFTDNSGYTIGTANKTETLPNNEPDILDTNREVSSTDHEFSFSAVANDRDGDGDITGCSIYAEDSDGNTQTLGSSDASYGNSTQVSCNSTVSSSLSGFEVGEDIQIYAEFTDVADAFASTAIYTETIPNHEPVVDSGPKLEKVPGEHSFKVSAVASDTDSGSSEINSCTVYAEDGDGNTKLFSGSGLVNQSYGTTDQASCNTSISNSISGFDVGETITVDVKFSDKHGAETSNVTGTKEIPNTAPGKPTDLNMTYFLSQGADLQHVLDHTPKINWTNPTDPEGDEITIKAYTESSPNPNQLDAETNSSNELSLGQNIGLSDGTTYNVSLRACDQYSCSNYTNNIEFTMNEEPSIQSVSLNSSSVTGSDSVKLQANITDTQDQIDWANYTVYNQSSGTQIYSNQEGTLSSELWNSNSFEVLAGKTYNWTLKTSDGYQTSSTTGIFSVSNSPPEIIKKLTTTEYSNAHKFNASAVAYEPDGEINIDKFNITLSDGDGNQKKFTKNVTKTYGNSSEVAANFSNVNTSTVSGFKVNEEISVSIKFIDKGGKTASTSGTQRIPNKVPEVPQKLNMTYFLSQGADLQHVLDHTPKINWTNPTDPEGDSVTIKAYTGQSASPTSLDNSINLGTSYGDSSSLNLGNSVSLSDGNTYNTTLIACDSYGCSSRSENIEFHLNEEPVIDNTALNDSSPTGSDFVKLLSNVTDNEDQISDVEFTVWNTDSNTKILSNSPGSGSGEWKSNKFEVFASTSYNWTVNATDGYEHTLDTGTFSVPNTAPSMISGPSFQNYNSGHKFNVSAVAEDVDGQENFANYTIQLDDGEKVYEYTKDVTRGFGGENEVAANFSNVNASIDGFEVGETIFVTVIFRDKSGETTQNFESHTIPNHKPTKATNINMSQLLEPGTDLQHVIDQTPEINFTAPSDSDNDNITLSIFTEASSNPSQLDREVLITEANYSSSQEIEIGNQINLNDGTSYNFSVQVCDQYGSCTSKEIIQEFHTNQEPVFNSVKLNKSSSNLTDGDNVHLIANISDAESDSIDWANFTVYNQTDDDRLINSLNGSISNNGNWISDTWTVSTGTTYNWTVNATDGYETSDTSGTFKTNNSNPEILSGPSFGNIIGDHAFNVSAVVKDADGADNLADYTLVLEDGDGNQKTVEKNITNTGYGNENEASINFSEVNTSIQGFQVNDDIQATITVRDSSGASAQTPTRSNKIPNEVPGKPTDMNMTYFLQENTNLNHVIDQTPEINWTNPTDPEGDQITVKAYTGTSSNPTTLDDSISGGNKLSLGQNAEILDGETYNVRLQACDPYGCSSYTSTIEFTMNQEPFIESVNANSSQITGSDQIKLEANITDSQDTINWANFTVYNQTSGELLFENKAGTLTSDLWKSGSWETRADTIYNYTVHTSDGYQTSNTTGTITVNNQQPEITGLSTDNYDKGHKFNISATANDEDGAINIEKFNITLSDGDGNQEEIKASVNRDFGTENQAALNYSNINASHFQEFEVEETLNIDVEVIDRSGSSSSSSTENAIPNHVPDLPQNLDLEVRNESYVVDHSFKINWTNPSDSDEDNLTVKAYLGTDQDPLTVENDTSITSAEYGGADELTLGENNVNLQDNQDYVIDLVACDNWSCTSRDTTASFHMNQEPRVESVELNESVSEEAEWIKLIANVTATDNPLDAAFYEVWNQSSPQKLVDEKIDSTSGETWNSSIFYGKSLQTYNWTFTASDSFENTTAMDVFDVGNADPEITTEIETTDLQNEHGFNISMKVRDLNGDKDLANYTVIADDGEQTHRYTRNFAEDGDEYAWANYSNINSSISEFEVGETISVQIIARDQHGLTTYSSTVSNTIPNRAPVITSINLKPNKPTTEDTLNITYTVEDPENDEITNSFFEWTGNSSTVSSRTVSPTDTSKDQHWNLSLQVVDEYNALSQENKSQETLVIQNSPPNIDKIQEATNISGEHAYKVSAVVQDPNGETDLQSNCEVYLEHETNNKTVQEEIETSYSGSEKAQCSYIVNGSKTSWIKPGEKINTTFTFTDKSSESITTAKKTSVVPNRKPAVTELTAPVNNSETNSTEIKFDWKAQDPEGDNLKYKLELFNETEKIRTKSDLTQSETTISGLESSRITWQVTIKDIFNSNELSTNTSDTNNLLVDSKHPQIVKNPQIKVINSTRGTPLQNQSVRCYTRWSDNFELGKATIYDNSTQTNTSLTKQEFSNGWANKTITASELTAGSKKCKFHVSDHLGNNASTSITFDVEDIEKPNITNFDFSPTTKKALDPEEPIKVNATVTDNLGLDNVSLLYRKEGGDWKLGNLTHSGNEYTGNFTPQESGVQYEFKYEAVDTYGNEINVNDSVNVQWDYTWSRTPSSYSGSSTIENNLVDYAPIQIENTGDYALKYNITTKKDSNLDLNIGERVFKIPAGEKKAIGLEAKLKENSADNEGIYSFQINIQSENSTANPSLEGIDGQATFTLDSPFLSMERGSGFSLSVSQGTEGVDLSVDTTNVGTQQAEDASISWEIPDSWELSSGSTKADIGNLSVDETAVKTITVDIPSDASPGTKKVNVTTTTTNRTFDEIFKIDITENETTVVVEEGGGGGFGGGPTGPTSQEQVEMLSDQIFNTTESFEIVRGEDQNFTVEFQNPTKFNLTNITANVEGIQSQYLNLVNPNLGRVNINESKNITVQIAAPEYFQTGDYDLSFNITGKGQSGEGPYADYFDFTLNKDVSLGVRAISQENASELLNQTRKLIEDMESSNLSTEDIQSLASEAENSLESGNYGSVRELYQQAQSRYQTAREVRTGLEELEKQINSAQASGLSVGRSRQLASLAEAAMERGAYSTAADRLEEARSVYQLQTAGEVNWIYEIRTHWKSILAAIIIISTALFLTRLRYRLYKIRKRLKELESEEKSIEDLKIQKQKKAFEEKDISLSEYEDSVDDYNEQIVKIIEERVELETEKANITNFKRRNSLAQERDQLKELIEETQRDYVEGNISDDEIYREKVEELTGRLSEIEGEIAEIDAQAKVRSQSRLGRIMERIPIISSGGKVQ
jgi:hypothetical protein